MIMVIFMKEEKICTSVFDKFIATNICYFILVTCFSYLIPDEDPGELNSAQVQVVWQNEAGREIDLFWVTSDGTEHFATSVPAAGRRTWPSENSFVYVFAIVQF